MYLKNHWAEAMLSRCIVLISEFIWHEWRGIKIIHEVVRDLDQIEGTCGTFIPYSACLSMAPTTKSKAISASSFLELKAELAKKEEEIAKLKAAGKSTAIVGGPKRPDKVFTCSTLDSC